MPLNSFLSAVNHYVLNPIIILMFAVALLVFFWGLVEFIASAGSDSGRERGRRNIMWGIVGMLIMISVYGIIAIILNTFGLNTPEYIAPLINR